MTKTNWTKDELVDLLVDQCFDPNYPTQDIDSVHEILADIASGDDTWTIKEAAEFAWNDCDSDWLEELYSNSVEYSQSGIDFSELENEIKKVVIERYVSDFEDEVEEMRGSNE